MLSSSKYTVRKALRIYRDTLLLVDPNDPRIRNFNLEIRQLVHHHKQTKWIERLKSCNLSAGVSKLWISANSRSNRRIHDDLPAWCYASSDLKTYMRYFSWQVILHPSVDKAKRRVRREDFIKKANCLNSSAQKGYITKVLNLLLTTINIPYMWKIGRVTHYWNQGNRST